ncbi:MAG: hypothetical protein WA705_02545 [Candidatus Ozemobacteraceae bacterium]
MISGKVCGTIPGMVPGMIIRFQQARQGFGIFRSLAGACALLFLLFSIGCSGGGSGGGASNGTGVDPIEVEIGVSVDLFLGAIASGSIDRAMQEVDSNLQYHRAGSQVVLGYTGFKEKLGNFLAGVSSISIALTPRSVVPDGENAATVHGTLTYSYVDASGTPRSAQEACEIYYARIARWGIQSLSGPNQTSMSFPPTP